MIDVISKLITGVISPVTDLIDELHTSEEEKLMLKNKLFEAQSHLAVSILKHTEKMVKAQKEIIIAEIKGSWLSANWRPILMLSIVAIIVNNFLIYPYLSMFTDKVVVLELPDKLYNLMTAGVGGYVAGRSVEKTMDLWNKK